MKQDSPGYRFVELFSNSCLAQGKPRGRQHRQGLIYEVTSMAVRGGLQFDRDDFSRRWWCVWGEDTYALACIYGNISACKSMEKAFRRKPFFLEGQRLYIGALFEWPGTRYAKVTSMSKDYLIACAYRKNVPEARALDAIKGVSGSPMRVEKRLRLTHKDMREESDRRKKHQEEVKAKELELELTCVCDQMGFGIDPKDAASLDGEQVALALRWLHNGSFEGEPMPEFLKNITG